MSETMHALVERARAYKPYNHLNDGKLVASLLDLIAQQAATIAARDDELIGERWHADEAARQRDAAKAALTAAEAEVGRLRGVLEFYSIRMTYVARTGMDSPISRDHFGDRARACLSSKKEG